MCDGCDKQVSEKCQTCGKCGDIVCEECQGCHEYCCWRDELPEGDGMGSGDVYSHAMPTG